MFIFPHKLVLKTCGTTTLLLGLPRILEIAALDAGFPHTPADLGTSTLAASPPYRVFYSRKNFLFPDQQRGPHRSWRDEVRTLDRLFLRGSAYMIGKMNGEHWYLYITEPDTRLTPPATPEHERVDGQETQTRRIDLPAQMDDLDIGEKQEETVPDETLEILMTDLDVDSAKQFYLEHAEFIAGDKQHSEGFRQAKQRTMSALDLRRAHYTRRPLRKRLRERRCLRARTRQCLSQLHRGRYDARSRPRQRHLRRVRPVSSVSCGEIP
jgi:S-adenosylmethionine decarboxylase